MSSVAIALGTIWKNYPPLTAGSIDISSVPFTELSSPLRWRMSSPFTYRFTKRLTSPLSSMRFSKSGPNCWMSLSSTVLTVVLSMSRVVSRACVTLLNADENLILTICITFKSEPAKALYFHECQFSAMQAARIRLAAA